MAENIYRCGQCDENWPAMDEFKECPGCGTPCISALVGDPPSVEDARKRAAYAKFNRYLREETEEERANREANSPYKTQFDSVIEGGGFAEWERDSIQSAEDNLKQKAA